jgi:DNA-binding transcriptional ArsR family regulator
VSNPRIEEAYAAIADPTRRRILHVLKNHGPTSSGAIAGQLPDLARPGVSRHLGILARAGFLRSEVQAQRRIYRLHRDGFERLALEWIGFLEADWAQGLSDLKRQVESSEGLLD